MTVTRNALSTASQTVVGAIILFVLYRQVLSVLGAEQLGIWSIVLATVSASRIGEFGLSAGVTRFVAKHRAEDDPDGASSVVQTAAVTITLLLAVVAVAAYPLLELLFLKLFDAPSAQEAIRILPIALLSLLTTTIAAVFQAGLDACHRYDLRAALFVATQTIFLAVAIYLMPQQGLLGLAYAQLLQGVLQVLGGWILLRRLMPQLPLLPLQWRRSTLEGMLGFGLQFQLLSIAQLLFEPLTKVLMGSFGGLAVTGYYEMARQVVGRVHQLFVSANQVIVPLAAGARSRDAGAIENMFRDAMKLVIVIALLSFSLVAAWSPLLAEIWLGEADPRFIVFMSVLSLSLGLNALAGPAYFSNVGTGALVWNTSAVIGMGVVNGSLGLLLGPSFGAAGILAASTIAITVGSLVPVVSFLHRYHIPVAAILPEQIARIGAVAIGIPVVTQVLYAYSTDQPASMRFMLCITVPVAVLAVVCWHNPQCRFVALKLSGGLRLRASST